MKRTPRRPSSASPTSRPRRVAGQGTAPAAPSEPDHPAEEPGAGQQPEPAERSESPEPDPEPEAEPEAEPEPDVATEPEPKPDPGPSFVASARMTRILLAVVAVLAVLTLAGGIYVWVHDDEPQTAVDDGPAVAADAQTPVRISSDDAQVAVAAAAQAAYTIVATSYQDYDAQVEEAAELMTPAFADDYRKTAADVEDAIVSSKTEVQVSVVAQGVVRADQDEVQALVFLNQVVTKNGKQPVFTPYRALVTVVNTDQGWLVSDLQTK